MTPTRKQWLAALLFIWLILGGTILALWLSS